MENESKSTRLLTGSRRYMSFVAYDPYPGTLTLDRLLSMPSVADAAYILHDRDDKTPHYHVVLMLQRSRRISDVISALRKSIFGGNILYEPVRDGAAVYDYLTHATDSAKDKYQYSPDDLVASLPRDTWQQTYAGVCPKSCDDYRDTVMMGTIDLINGDALTDVMRRYGRDFIIHYGHIRTLLIDMGCRLIDGYWYAPGDPNAPNKPYNPYNRPANNNFDTVAHGDDEDIDDN